LSVISWQLNPSVEMWNLYFCFFIPSVTRDEFKVRLTSDHPRGTYEYR